MESNQPEVLEIKRDFEVSKKILFNAWTTEADLKNWWKPLNSVLIKVDNDLKTSGKFLYQFDHQSEVEPFTIEGEYQEVVIPAKLVYTWKWKMKNSTVATSSFKLTIMFEGNDNKSSITVRQEDLEYNESIHPKKQGWEDALAGLQDYLSGRTVPSHSEADISEVPSNGISTERHINSMNHAENLGYDGLPEQEKVGG